MANVEWTPMFCKCTMQRDNTAGMPFIQFLPVYQMENVMLTDMPNVSLAELEAVGLKDFKIGEKRSVDGNGDEIFIGRLVCPEHVALEAIDPQAAFDAVFKESTDHTDGLRAVIDTELAAEWPGETWQKVDAAVDKAYADNEITEDNDLRSTDPVLALKHIRVLALINSKYTMSGTAPNRTGLFDVNNQKVTNVALDAALSTAVPDRQIGTTLKTVSR